MSRHDPKLSGIRSRFPLRRKILLGIVVALLALVAWLHYTGAAATHGITTQDMDWDSNGTVTQGEIAQAVFRRGDRVVHAVGSSCLEGRGPNRALPMRTMVAPSAIASAKSSLMPIERVSMPG